MAKRAKRVYLQDTVYVNRITRQLQAIRIWAIVHNRQKDVIKVAVSKGRKVLVRHANLLLPYVYRSRINKDKGLGSRDLTKEEKQYKNQVINDYLKGFEAIIKDAVSR